MKYNMRTAEQIRGAFREWAYLVAMKQFLSKLPDEPTDIEETLEKVASGSDEVAVWYPFDAVDGVVVVEHIHLLADAILGVMRKTAEQMKSIEADTHLLQHTSIDQFFVLPTQEKEETP